jgi:hypothetical protein
MAAKEIKSISVPPSAEEATINLWQAFGWELKSTQEIKTQDVQVFTEQIGNTKYYETTKGEHYIKLTFERDPSRPNYAELCDLEKKYEATSYFPTIPTKPNEPTNPIDPVEEPKRFGCLTFFLIILSISPFFWIGIPCLIYQQVTYSKKHAEWKIKHTRWQEEEFPKWEIEYANWQKECDSIKKMKPEIIKRAKELL